MEGPHGLKSLMLEAPAASRPVPIDDCRLTILKTRKSIFKIKRQELPNAENSRCIKAGGLAWFRHNVLTCPIQETWIMLKEITLIQHRADIERTGHEKL